MDEPVFRFATHSTDEPSAPVPGDLAKKGRAVAATLQTRASQLEAVSHELDDVVREAAAMGATSDRIAAELDVGTDLVDAVVRGGSSWRWLFGGTTPEGAC